MKYTDSLKQFIQFYCSNTNNCENCGDDDCAHAHAHQRKPISDWAVRNEASLGGVDQSKTHVKCDWAMNVSGDAARIIASNMTVEHAAPALRSLLMTYILLAAPHSTMRSDQ